MNPFVGMGVINMKNLNSGQYIFKTFEADVMAYLEAIGDDDRYIQKSKKHYHNACHLLHINIIYQM